MACPARALLGASWHAARCAARARVAMQCAVLCARRRGAVKLTGRCRRPPGRTRRSARRSRWRSPPSTAAAPAGRRLGEGFEGRAGGFHRGFRGAILQGRHCWLSLLPMYTTKTVAPPTRRKEEALTAGAHEHGDDGRGHEAGVGLGDGDGEVHGTRAQAHGGGHGEGDGKPGERGRRGAARCVGGGAVRGRPAGDVRPAWGRRARLASGFHPATELAAWPPPQGRLLHTTPLCSRCVGSNTRKRRAEQPCARVGLTSTGRPAGSPCRWRWAWRRWRPATGTRWGGGVTQGVAISVWRAAPRSPPIPRPRGPLVPACSLRAVISAKLSPTWRPTAPGRPLAASREAHARPMSRGVGQGAPAQAVGLGARLRNRARLRRTCQ